MLRLAGAAAIGAVLVHQADAQQSPSPASQSAADAAVGDNNGEDFTRPDNLFQLRNLFQTAPGKGFAPGTTRTVTTNSTVLRADYKFNIIPQWTVVLRGDLPFTTKNAITSVDPTGDYAYGLGDADVQAALIRTMRFAVGDRRRSSHYRSHRHQ